MLEGGGCRPRLLCADSHWRAGCHEACPCATGLGQRTGSAKSPRDGAFNLGHNTYPRMCDELECLARGRCIGIDKNGKIKLSRKEALGLNLDGSKVAAE